MKIVLSGMWKHSSGKKAGLSLSPARGCMTRMGNPIVKPVFKTERATYFGDVSSHLANLVIDRLGYKARGEKTGTLGAGLHCLAEPCRQG